MKTQLELKRRLLATLINRCDETPLVKNEVEVYDAACVLAFGPLEDDLDDCINSLTEEKVDAFITICEKCLHNG